MFSLAKASAAVLAFASFAQATITILTTDLKGNSTGTIKWSSSDLNTDPVSFTIELHNEIFHSDLALANNIQTTQGAVSFQMPVVPPGPGYTVVFVQNGNINTVYATSNSFTIQENDVSTSTGSSSSSSSSGSSIASASSTSALPSTGSLTQTASGVASTPAVTVSSVSAATPTSPSASATVGATPSSAAMELIPSGSLAVFIAGAIALLF